MTINIESDGPMKHLSSSCPNSPNTPGSKKSCASSQRTISGADMLFPNSSVILLFYVPEMEEVAREVEEMCHGEVRLGEIKWDRFNDGFPNLLIEDSQLIKWSYVAFLASFHSPGVIFEQLALIASLPRYLARELKLIIPYYPTGTMERVTIPGQVATAKSLARLVSSIPMTRGGPVQLTLFDIHTLQNQFYFDDSVLVWLKSCVHLLRDHLDKMVFEDGEDVSIAFPDEGAFKRFHLKFTAYETIICDKVRGEGDSRIVKVKDGDAKGRHVLIIDDLVQTGGTLVKCAEALKECGAASVSCYVTHAIFPKESWKHFTEGGQYFGLFEKFFITNTHPPMSKLLAGKPPFEVLSIAPIVTSIVMNRPVGKINTAKYD
eukprot:174867_1